MNDAILLEIEKLLSKLRGKHNLACQFPYVTRYFFSEKHGLKEWTIRRIIYAE